MLNNKNFNLSQYKVRKTKAIRLFSPHKKNIPEAGTALFFLPAPVTKKFDSFHVYQTGTLFYESKKGKLYKIRDSLYDENINSSFQSIQVNSNETLIAYGVDYKFFVIQDLVSGKEYLRIEGDGSILPSTFHFDPKNPDQIHLKFGFAPWEHHENLNIITKKPFLSFRNEFEINKKAMLKILKRTFKQTQNIHSPNSAKAFLSWLKTQ